MRAFFTFGLFFFVHAALTQFVIPEISFNKSTYIDTSFTADGKFKKLTGSSPFGYTITYTWEYHKNGKVSKELRRVDLVDFDFPIQINYHEFDQTGAFLLDSNRRFKLDSTWECSLKKWERTSAGKEKEVYLYNDQLILTSQEHWKNGKVITTSTFEYHKDGQLKIEKEVNKKGKVVRSVQYNYTQGELSQIVTYVKGKKKVKKKVAKD